MTKNNLKVVKTGKNQEVETKEKTKALEAAISQIDENFGKGSVMKLGQKAAINVEAVSTGSLSLDLATSERNFLISQFNLLSSIGRLTANQLNLKQ